MRCARTVGLNPPTTEYLYAVDGLGNQVFEFAVNTTYGSFDESGEQAVSMPAFATDQTPAGVAVDPCNRFVYVSDSLTEQSQRLHDLQRLGDQPAESMRGAGSRALGTGSGFAVRPCRGARTGRGRWWWIRTGNYLYVLGTLSNTINPLQISPVSGSLTPLNPATVATGIGPRSIVIRADDSWMFVTNYGSTRRGRQHGVAVCDYARRQGRSRRSRRFRRTIIRGAWR